MVTMVRSVTTGCILSTFGFPAVVLLIGIVSFPYTRVRFNATSAQSCSLSLVLKMPQITAQRLSPLVCIHSSLHSRAAFFNEQLLLSTLPHVTNPNRLVKIFSFFSWTRLTRFSLYTTQKLETEYAELLTVYANIIVYSYNSLKS